MEFEYESIRIPALRPYFHPNVAPNSLGAIVRVFKASVTYRINIMRGFSDPPVWQRNYYEHIIRNEKDYETIHNYIETNPVTWKEDQIDPYPTSK